LVAVPLVLAWAITGPYFQYSEAWQLVINTGTTIATFLLVFVLQNTQIRETKALTVKLDELLRAVDGARTSLVNVEDLPDEEIDQLCSELKRLGRIAESGTGRARLSISSRQPESR
jgi:low affinity Fe/Cu permease